MSARSAHAQPWNGTTGETSIGIFGMAVDNFTEQDADAVRAMLAKHGLAEQFSVELGVEESDDFYGLVPADGTAANPTMVLNRDDESYGFFKDDLVPGAFIFELCQLLAAIAVRGICGSPVTYMQEAARKGWAVTYENSPAWSDYEWLLKL